ncbi:hypothetical protein HDU86_008333 [Geranomyces michiganensis]|nr:hypothetical protein HDU86_008333 [Geranomyces michiganensis]
MSCNLSAVSEYCIGRDMRFKEWFVQQQALVPGREKKSFPGLMNWWLKEGQVSDKDWFVEKSEKGFTLYHLTGPTAVVQEAAARAESARAAAEADAEEGKKKKTVDDDFEDEDLEYPQDIESGDFVGLGFDDKFKAERTAILSGSGTVSSIAGRSEFGVGVGLGKGGDVGHVIQKGIHHIKDDMKRWKPCESPGKICIAMAGDHGPVYYVMLVWRSLRRCACRHVGGPDGV